MRWTFENNPIYYTSALTHSLSASRPGWRWMAPEVERRFIYFPIVFHGQPPGQAIHRALVMEK